MTPDRDRPTAPGLDGPDGPAASASSTRPDVDAPHPWADTDRPRGLDAPFAPGGEDDAPPDRRADERRLTRLLILFVALLVGVPTLLTLIAFAGQLLAMRSGG